MEPTCKIRLLLFALLSALALEPARADEEWPNDFPTITALIENHKQMKKAEDAATTQLFAIEETHSLTQRVTSAVNKTRTILNKRMSDANSYVSLALQLANVTTKAVGIVENYTDFTKSCYKYAEKNPFVLAYYTDANLKLKNEIKHMEKLVAGYSAAGLNLLKATMQEKYRVLAQINNSLFRIECILSRARLLCRSMLPSGVQLWHVQDMLDSDLSDSISKKIIALWKSK